MADPSIKVESDASGSDEVILIKDVSLIFLWIYSIGVTLLLLLVLYTGYFVGKDRRIVFGHKKLLETYSKYQSLFLCSFDGIFEIDRRTLFTSISPSIIQDFGYSYRELIHQPIDKVILPEEQEHVLENLNNVFHGQAQRFEAKIIHKNGKVKTFDFLIVPKMKQDTVTGIIGICKDITEEHVLKEKLHYLAYHDDLTGLPNLRYFKHMVKNRILKKGEGQEKVAILYLTIDRFKMIHELLGHKSSDELLLQLADRLKACLPTGEGLARCGSDEFTILLTNVDHCQMIDQFTDKIFEQIAKPVIIGEHEFIVSSSIGVSLYPRDGEDEAALIKHAHLAMYQANVNGRNRVQYFHPGMNADHLFRKTLLNDLQVALQKGEFKIYYQPKKNMAKEEVIGAEALLRWEHASMGMVSPSFFIPLAEESGMIHSLGEWVLDQVCQQLRRWMDAGYSPKRISINISSRQFYDDDLVCIISKLLHTYQIQGSLLELEITESIAMMDQTYVVRKLYQLKELGIKISVDDFGTGYSSLGYLQSYPIDIIKIDQTFVQNLGKDCRSASIIKAVISVGQNLGMSLIAEGVETEEQISFLRKQNCQEVQGYLISPPLPAAEFEEQFMGSWMDCPKAYQNG